MKSDYGEIHDIPLFPSSVEVGLGLGLGLGGKKGGKKEWERVAISFGH